MSVYEIGLAMEAFRAGLAWNIVPTQDEAERALLKLKGERMKTYDKASVMWVKNSPEGRGLN